MDWTMESTKGPIISVIMPAYNSGRTIAQSIASVRGQSFRDWELLVIDDCSWDDTLAIAKAEASGDARISVHRQAKNMGVSAARNAAMLLARGEWLAFLDSDDTWQVDKLDRQLAFAQATGATLTYTSTAYMDADGSAYGYVLRAEDVLTYGLLLRRNLLSCSSVMVRRASMRPFPQGYMHEDYAVWLELLRDEPARGLDAPLLTYRLSNASKSAGRLASARMIFNSYRYVGYRPLCAIFLTILYSKHSILKRLQVRMSKTTPKAS